MKVQVPGFEPGPLAFVPLHFFYVYLLKRLEGQNPNQLDYTCLREESEPSLNTFPQCGLRRLVALGNRAVTRAVDGTFPYSLVLQTNL